ncbi:hypothetical protein N182_36850 [Sinorhizobium sp. GL2]|nr:hypothetical protein N182_36850 [Sinorhizobium sp. GL2]
MIENWSMARRFSGGLRLLTSPSIFSAGFCFGVCAVEWIAAACMCRRGAPGLGFGALVRTIAMIVKLLGVGKRALDRRLAALVDRLAPGRQARSRCIGPDMTGDGAGRSGV